MPLNVIKCAQASDGHKLINYTKLNMVNPNEMSTYGRITARSTPAMTLAGAEQASGRGAGARVMHGAHCAQSQAHL